MNIYIYKIAFDNSQDLIMWQDALTKDLIIWCTELWLVNNNLQCSCFYLLLLEKWHNIEN